MSNLFEESGYRVVKSLVEEDKFYWIRESEQHFSEDYFDSEDEAIENWMEVIRV